MCKSTGSMLWMSMFVTTYKKKWTFYELTLTRSDNHGWAVEQRRNSAIALSWVRVSFNLSCRLDRDDTS